MARLWDTNMADRAAAIDQAIKLGGRVVEPPKSKPTGFHVPPEPSGAGGSHLPGDPDERY